MYLSHRRPAKAQASLRIRAVSSEPSLFAQMKYGSRRRVQQKIRHLAPLDGCACAFEEWVYGGRKVTTSWYGSNVIQRTLRHSVTVLNSWAPRKLLSCSLLWIAFFPWSLYFCSRSATINVLVPAKQMHSNRFPWTLANIFGNNIS